MKLYKYYVANMKIVYTVIIDKHICDSGSDELKSNLQIKIYLIS